MLGVWMNERKNERMNERSDERTKERTNEQNEQTNRRTNARKSERTDERSRRKVSSIGEPSANTGNTELKSINMWGGRNQKDIAQNGHCSLNIESYVGGTFGVIWR